MIKEILCSTTYRTLLLRLPRLWLLLCSKEDNYDENHGNHRERNQG